MLRLFLLPAYPLLVHLAVLRESAALAGIALFVFAALSLFDSLLAGQRSAWLGLGASTAAILGLVRYGGAEWLLYLPPIALPMIVLLAFGNSLLPGRTPLVSAMATRVHGPLPAPLARYTRGVTWLWTLVIAVMLLLNLVLSLRSSRAAWSAFTNGGDYLLLIGVFLGEYAVRRLRFRALRQPRFLDYLRLVAQHRPGNA